MRLTIADFIECLESGSPPWADYRAFMGGWIIALDKQPGVRTVRVGETWRHLMLKHVPRVSVQEEKAVCGTENLVGGVKAGI